MADKELNPSPKFPEGTYPELSPNPKFENGLIDKTGEQPNGREQTNPQEKPTVFNGEVDINGTLKVNGKEIQLDAELPGTSEATAGQVLKLDANKVPEWADDAAGMTNPMTTAGDLIVGGTDGVPTRLAKGSNGDLLRVNSNGQVAYGKGLPYDTTAPSADNTDGLIVIVLDSEPATKYNGYLYIITGE